MIRTYDWLIWAYRQPELKKKIEEALLRDEPHDLFIGDTFKISFDPKNQMVTVNASSEDCFWSHKILPKRITYYVVRELMNGNIDAFSGDGIFDVEKD